MQLRYVYSELAQGLRRNVSMHLAVVLTLFVSLTLVGLGVLLNQQAARAADQWGSQLEITVWLCKEDDDSANCRAQVTEPQRAVIEQTILDHPQAASVRYESQEVAFDKVEELLGEDSDGIPPETKQALRESFWIELEDPSEYEDLTAAVLALDGVSSIRDMREVLEPIYGSLDAMKWGALGTAAFLVLASLLLVGNTIRLAALARRREIAIMRLVGASASYITLPFLLEALVTAAIGVVLAGSALAAFVRYGIEQNVGQRLQFVPWVGTGDLWYAAGFVAVLGPLLTVVPTLVLARKYLRV